MPMYRLQKEVSNYLSVEIIGHSNQDVIEQFATWAIAKCRRSGGKWAAEELTEVIERQHVYISEIVPGVTVDGEPAYVHSKAGDVAKVLKDTEMGVGYYESMYLPRPIDTGIIEAALLQAGKDPGDYGYTPAAQIEAEMDAADEALLK